MVGKINEPKLKNLQHIDMYTIVGCPMISLVGFKQWNIHVVTPHEVLMALNSQSFPWNSQVITDYNQLLDVEIKPQEETE